MNNLGTRPATGVPIALEINDHVTYRGILGEIKADAQIKGITRGTRPLLDLQFTNGQTAAGIPIKAVELSETTLEASGL